MLTKLLRRLAEQDARSIPELAEELRVQPPLVHMMLDELAQRGYLRALADCAIDCHGCAVRAPCSIAEKPKVWIVTEKGADFLRAISPKPQAVRSRR
ncbi:MAG: helix-turn-helix domain-containing protein [Gammaproteobacteria bacterium]